MEYSVAVFVSALVLAINFSCFSSTNMQDVNNKEINNSQGMSTVRKVDMSQFATSVKSDRYSRTSRMNANSDISGQDWMVNSYQDAEKLLNLDAIIIKDSQSGKTIRDLAGKLNKFKAKPVIDVEPTKNSQYPYGTHANQTNTDKNGVSQHLLTQILNSNNKDLSYSRNMIEEASNKSLSSESPNFPDRTTSSTTMNGTNEASGHMTKRNPFAGLNVMTCALDTIAIDLSFSEHVAMETGDYLLSCMGSVAVNKCEGMCTSKVLPSVNHIDGFEKVCSCCRDASVRVRSVTLTSCRLDNHDVVGYFLSRDIVEPASCVCSHCRN